MKNKLYTFVKTNKLFKGWLLSYISVLLVPVTISIIIYTQTGLIVTREINRANFSLLKQVCQDMDYTVNDINKIFMQLSMNPQINSIINQKGAYNPRQRYYIYEIVQELRSILATNSYINNLYIYVQNTGMVLYPQGHADSGMFYSFEHEKQHDIACDEWMEVVSGFHAGTFYTLKAKGEGGKPNTITCIQSLPMLSNTSLANLVILIDESRFQKSVDNIQWMQEGAVVILDKNNSIVASSDHSLKIPDSVSYRNLDNEGAVQYTEMNREDIAISFVHSHATDWKYVSIIPSRIFWEKSEYLRQISLIGIGLCLCLGFVISYLYSRKNYNPISTIIKTLADKLSLYYEKNTSEYLFIQQAIKKALDEREKAKKQLKQNSRILRDHTLMKLLKGHRYEEESLPGIMESNNIFFKSDFFAVILFHIDDYSKLFSESDSKEQNEHLKLVHFIICNIVEELAGQKNQGFVLELDEDEVMACILNFNQNNFSKEDIKQLIDRAKHFIEDNFQIKLTISASGIHESISGIHTAFHEALDAMEYRIIKGSGNVIYYDDIKHQSCYYNYSLETEQKFINCIKAGNLENARDILMKILDDNFSNASLSIEFARCLMFDLIGSMLKALERDGNSSFLEDLNPVRRLSKCNSMDTMKQEIILVLNSVYQYVQENLQNRKSQLHDEVLDYIQKNYMNINLCIPMIAAEFGFSAAYLSKIFKDQTGISIVDAINQVRLEKAKKYLTEKKMTIIETCKLVGYYNSNAMIRAFKKYEGITPGQYKELEVK